MQIPATMQKLLWFAALWFAGVTTVSIVGYAIKYVLS